VGESKGANIFVSTDELLRCSGGGTGLDLVRVGDPRRSRSAGPYIEEE